MEAPEARRRTSSAIRERLATRSGSRPSASTSRPRPARGWASSGAARASRRSRSRALAQPQRWRAARVARGDARDPPARHAQRRAACRCAPRDPGRVGIYACGPTVYSRIHIGNARPFVVFSLLKRFLAHEGYEVTLVINVTDVNDKIYDAAARAGLASAELARGDDRGLHRRHRRARPRPPRPRAAGLARRSDAIVAYIETLIDARPRLRGRRRRATSACARTPATARSRTAGSRTWTRARASRAPSASRTRWTSRCGRRTSRARTPLGLALGPRAARLAHRVLGDGRGAARRRLRHPRRRLGPASSPTTRTRPRRRAPRAARSWRALWMHNGMIQSTGEKMAKSVGNIALLHEVLERYGAEAVVMYLIGGHYRQPLAFSRGGARAGRRRNVKRIREAAAAAVAGRSPAELGDARSRERVLRRARATTSTRRRRWPRCTSGSREANRRGEPRSATRTCARCSACSAWRALLAPRRAGARARCASSPSSASRPARSATSRAPTRCATSSRALGWEVRDGAEPASSCCRCVIVYGRNPVREALRGRRAQRRVGDILGDARAPRASRGCAGVAVRSRLAPRRSSAAAARARIRASAREAGGLPLRLGGGAARGRAAADRRARPGAGSAEPRLDLPHRRVRRRGRRRDPRAPRRRGDPRRVQGLGRRRRAPARRARAQPRRLPARGARGPAAGATARAPTAPRAARGRPTTQPDYSGGGVVLVLGSEGRGLRPRVAGACDAADRAAAARADRVAGRQRRGCGAAVRDLADRARGP